MPHPRFTSEEIARRGEEIYIAQLRDVLEQEHCGEMVIINVESGEYEIGAALYGIRIGFPFVEKLGRLYNW